MQPIIRPATQEDLETLVHFQREIVVYELPMDPTIAADTQGYYDIDRLLADPETRLLVATVDGQLAGCSFGQIRAAEVWATHEHIGYIGMVYVRDEYRGLGICEQIFESLETWFRSVGVRELRLEVYEQNPSARRAYLKSGFSPLLVKMRKSLE